MATLAPSAGTADRTESFWLVSAVLMTLVLVAGFSVQLGMGRSSFGAPLYVHAHAVVFFGWVFLYLTQNILAGRRDLVRVHRKLGWLAVGWIPVMVALGTFVTVELVRHGRVPFFFTPAYFLIMDPLSVLTFAGLATAAIMMRRKTQWHRRLMFCAMTILLGPGFGRLLPVPFMIPYVGWGIFATFMLFPLAGVIRDLLRTGRVHPAWAWGIGTLAAAQIAITFLPETPLGTAIYDMAAKGSPGAAIAPNAYPPFPPGL